MEGEDPRNGQRFPDPVRKPTMVVEEAAYWLGISRGQGYEAARRGEIPSIRLGRRLVVPTAPLRRMLGLDEGDDGEGVSTEEPGVVLALEPSRRRASPPGGDAA